MAKEKQAWVTVTNRPQKLSRKRWRSAGHRSLLEYVDFLFEENKASLKKSGQWSDSLAAKHPFVRFVNLDSWEGRAFSTREALEAFSNEMEASGSVLEDSFWRDFIDLN